MRMHISVNGLRFVFFINVLILVVSKIDYAIIIKVGFYYGFICHLTLATFLDHSLRQGLFR
ncbi:hypothetical protein BM524_15790 [Alteromonas mediterranea]|uniref:Uncharacterized protein n=1 Tax=Alteromonas mediterranea TaxID=314275 RepID=A0AAC9NS02_9ALTE|nr:hypothetical protein BM524_15790 [Alteromonas mediterranea]